MIQHDLPGFGAKTGITNPAVANQMSARANQKIIVKGKNGRHATVFCRRKHGRRERQPVVVNVHDIRLETMDYRLNFSITFPGPCDIPARSDLFGQGAVFIDFRIGPLIFQNRMSVINQQFPLSLDNFCIAPLALAAVVIVNN